MSLKTFGANPKSRLFFAALVGAALLVAALTIGSANNANAESSVRAKKTKVLGAIGKLPEPLCPIDCEALAIVSGFQSEIGGIDNPYRVPFNGSITKWKISLGSVDKSQRMYFENRFGSKPKAQLSVLKPVTVDGKRQFRLMKRGPVEGLNKYLGDVASISLKKPIAVKKGWFVALTIPTWAPALSFVTPKDDFNWRASREKDTCAKPPNMNTSEPQQKVHSARTYGCRFVGAQLLYRVKVTNK